MVSEMVALDRAVNLGPRPHSERLWVGGQGGWIRGKDASSGLWTELEMAAREVPGDL
jgi:hypothetical protein